jgi:hypothetical protein
MYVSRAMWLSSVLYPISEALFPFFLDYTHPSPNGCCSIATLILLTMNSTESEFSMFVYENDTPTLNP